MRQRARIKDKSYTLSQLQKLAEEAMKERMHPEAEYYWQHAEYIIREGRC